MRGKAVSCERLGKRYRIGGQERYRSLRDVLAGAVNAPFRRVLRGGGRARDVREHFWALKDVSFEVAHGEVVGIIGRNGAGKSTLLKILSRITDPTEGEIDLEGRVGSLLEVGTGFHPELTGRENIYLNGAILGMKKAYINRRLDEIVEFAEIGQFIDTPVKRYSSGMYVRLAFAVAAHLEPDILIIDEVLAVGDAAFQKKCLGKMNEVSGCGKTVLFVSHNMQAVRRLCSRVMLLEGGSVIPVSGIEEAIQRYAADALTSDYDINLDLLDRAGDQLGRKARLLRLRLAPGSSCSYGRPLELIFTVESSDPTYELGVGISFSTLDGNRVLTLDSDHDRAPMRLAEGVHELRFLLPRNPLHPGTYSLGMVINSHGHGLDALFEQLTWRVDSNPTDPVTYLPFGGCRMPVDLSVERLQSLPPETAAPAHSC